MVIAVKTSPLIANKGTKYVRVAAVGRLAVLLGTCELLLKTVGRLKIASPALPMEIKRSTNVSNFSNHPFQMNNVRERRIADHKIRRWNGPTVLYCVTAANPVEIIGFRRTKHD